MKRWTKLTFNLLPAGCRIDQLEGRDYTVVPMVILTEGVHKGSQGPLYYPKEELAKTPVVWNHKPIVVYHPTMNGEGISACDPVVINSRKVGLMMNTKFEGGRLKSEAWIEKERANLVDERIMNAVEAKEMMELSTGVFVDVEETDGKWKGEEYEGIARNYRPDHLALLPDKVGACSIADGAGFLRNQASAKDMIAEGKKKVKQGEEEDDADMVAEGKKMMRDGKKMMSNEMSHSNLYTVLSAALRKKFPSTGDSGLYSCWIQDVYSNFVIYEKDGKLWRLGYTSSDTGVELSDEAPVEVMRVTEYRTTTGTYVGNQNQQEPPMEKKKKVDAIIATNSGWKEEDREALMALTDPQLDSIGTLTKEMPTVNFAMERAKDGKVTLNMKSKEQPSAPAAPVAQPGTAPVGNQPLPAGASAPANNQQDKIITVEEFVAKAPKGMQEVLNNSLAVYNEEKNKLVELILANERNGFTKADLEGRPLGELKMLARLAAKEEQQTSSRQPHYGGQGNVPTGNDAEEALEVPVMNFGETKRELATK